MVIVNGSLATVLEPTPSRPAQPSEDRSTLPGAMAEQCSWCGTTVGPDEGFRVAEPAAERKAVFCRLEHVVPWVIQGPRWGTGRIVRPDEPDDGLGRCALCGDDLGDTR